jgi:hypothetical protein
MASPLNTLSMSPEQLIMQQYEALNRQQAALQQPAPQQGGFLSGADPVMLSLAAGLLSPTKTGGFGESVAAGLSAASGPLSEIRKQEAARADKMSALQSAQAKLAMDLYEIRTGKRGARTDDPSLIAFRLESNAENYRKQAANIAANSSTDDPEYKKAIENANYYSDRAKAVLEGISPKAGGSDTGDVEGAIPTIKTQEEYNALPSGTQYIDPDGNMRIKSGTYSE